MRIVSLVPSLTETLFHLGLDREVVGVTNFCVHPKGAVARKRRVGGTKNPDVKAILALEPTLVVVNTEENRREDVDAIAKGGAPVHVTDIRTVARAVDAVRGLGEATGAIGPAKALAKRLEEAAREAAARRGPPVKVYCPIWRDPWMTMNGDTYAHDALAHAGAANVFADASARWCDGTPAEALARGAEAALLPSEPYPFSGKHVDDLVAAGFPRARVGLVDGEALTWYGVRTARGLHALVDAVDRVRLPGPRGL
ncbi:MAG TPA: helical backbone metal receptor [Candidatus Thermoplasmatota archaeon]|nr:helical backbone metal receptor [Candidatus Thermoplasmatota archaeon]